MDKERKNALIACFEAVANAQVELACTVGDCYDAGLLTGDDQVRIMSAHKLLSRALQKYSLAIKQIK